MRKASSRAATVRVTVTAGAKTETLMIIMGRNHQGIRQRLAEAAARKLGDRFEEILKVNRFHRVQAALVIEDGSQFSTELPTATTQVKRT